MGEGWWEVGGRRGRSGREVVGGGKVEERWEGVPFSNAGLRQPRPGSSRRSDLY